MTSGIHAEGAGLVAVKEWRVTYRSHDAQGGYWPMPPQLFSDYGEALKEYRRLLRGNNIDVKFEETIVITTQESP